MESNVAPPERPLLGEESPTLEEMLRQLGEPAFRVRQIRAWVFRKRAGSFDEMTDLSLPLRGRLARSFRVFSGEVLEVRRSIDATAKVVVRLADGEILESVLLREEGRTAACVSTQVGCPVGCPFCASGIDGSARNLRAHEIVEQVLLLDRLLPQEARLTHLVLMGIGEPLLNFEAVNRAIEILHSDDGYGMGARRITISTVGPRGKLGRLDRLTVPVNLAISLHAPDDGLRDTLVPGNAGVREILATAKRYRERTGREVTFEYVLLHDVNASPDHAHRLVQLVRGIPCTVNLIPFNPVLGVPHRPPRPDEVRTFRRILEEGGIAVTIRKRKGRAIDAACGQLRRLRLRGATPPHGDAEPADHTS